MEVSVKAPAKINLSLDIVGKRSDGYHEVMMVLQAISLYDTVKVTCDKDTESEEIKITCTDPVIPTDDSNIVAKAARAFFKYTNEKQHKLTIDIEKNIPSQAGLAGGSTDAAAVLLALNLIYDTRLNNKTLCEIASFIGADVPFCIQGGTMLATETGTTLEKLIHLKKCYIVLVKPDISVSTKEAYDKCDSKPYKQFKYTEELVNMLYKRSIRNVCSVLYNEFEQVLDLPEINEIKLKFMDNKALGTSMSGSGSAVYGIFDSEKKAQKCKENLEKEYKKVYLVTPIKDGCKVI